MTSKAIGIKLDKPKGKVLWLVGRLGWMCKVLSRPVRRLADQQQRGIAAKGGGREGAGVWFWPKGGRPRPVPSSFDFWLGLPLQRTPDSSSSGPAAPLGDLHGLPPASPGSDCSRHLASGTANGSSLFLSLSAYLTFLWPSASPINKSKLLHFHCEYISASRQISLNRWTNETVYLSGFLYQPGPHTSSPRDRCVVSSWENCSFLFLSFLFLWICKHVFAVMMFSVGHKFGGLGAS